MIEGADDVNDNFMITRPAAGQVRVTDNRSGIAVTETGSSGTANVQVNGLNGADTLNVNVAARLGCDSQSDHLRRRLGHRPADCVRHAGNDRGRGNIHAGLGDHSRATAYEDASNARLMSIDFVNIEPTMHLVPAALLTVNGTNADNAINYIQGPNNGTVLVGGATTGQVSVDGFESIEFANKASLVD